MKDKIKELLGDWVAWILVLIIGVILYIVKLIFKIDSLKEKVQNLVFKQNMQKDTDKQKELSDAANKAENDYDTAKREFLRDYINPSE